MFFFFWGDVAFSEYCFVPFPLSLCTESTSYVLSFRIVFFYVVTTGWVFDIISLLCESSASPINQSDSAIPSVENERADAGRDDG